MRCDGDGSTEEEELGPDVFHGNGLSVRVEKDATEVEEFLGVWREMLGSPKVKQGLD